MQFFAAAFNLNCSYREVFNIKLELDFNAQCRQNENSQLVLYTAGTGEPNRVWCLGQNEISRPSNICTRNRKRRFRFIVSCD